MNQTKMKRYLITLIALSTAVIGCTKSGLVESPQKYQAPITFETYTGKTPETKASEVTTVTLTSHQSASNPALHVNAFLVSSPQSYASTYMSKDLWCKSVTYDDPDTDNSEFAATWTYSGATYWPDNGSLLFVAYGLNAEKTITAGASSYNTITWDNTLKHSKFTYRVPAKASEQEDLIVAVPQTQGISNNTASNVLLNFKHMLSKVGFSLKTDATNVVDITIKSIKLNGSFYSYGVVDLTTTMNYGTESKTDMRPYVDVPTTQVPDVTSYSLFDAAYQNSEGTYDCFQIHRSPGNTATPIYANTTLSISNSSDVDDVYTDFDEDDEEASVLNRYMMLIPSTQSNATIEVVYELEGAKEKTATASLGNSFSFEAGKAYEFVIKMNTSSIEFEAGVSGWDDTTVTGESIILKPVIL